MKWINLLFVLLISNLSFGQLSLLDSVTVKFKNDKRALEEFKVLGKLYCLDKAIDNNDIYFQSYASMYNGFSPFVRLLEKEKIELFFNVIINSEGINLYIPKDSSVFFNNRASYYYELYNNINKKWENDNMKKYYIQLVSDTNNYIKPLADNFNEDDINSFLRNYLNAYFIEPATDQ